MINLALFLLSPEGGLRYNDIIGIGLALFLVRFGWMGYSCIIVLINIYMVMVVVVVVVEVVIVVVVVVEVVSVTERVIIAIIYVFSFIALRVLEETLARVKNG